MVTRVILGVVGAVLLLCGIAAGVAAGWAYTTFGTSGLLRFDQGTVTPGPGALATVIDVDRFRVSVPYVETLGEAALAVLPVDGADPVFVGAGTTADADAYLAGVPYTAAFRVSGEWTGRDVPGGQAPPPADAAPWLASATGSPATITVPSARPLSLVVVRPAGTPTGPFALSIEFRVPDARNWIIGLAVAAGVLVLVGALLIVLALRRRRPMGRHAAGAVPPVAAVEEPVVDEPVVDEPVVDEPVVEEPVVEEPEPATPAGDPVDPDATAELVAVVADPEPAPEPGPDPVPDPDATTELPALTDAPTEAPTEDGTDEHA